MTYPAGFMDVVSLPKSSEHFRLLYDTKGRYVLNTISDEESKFKLCKVKKTSVGPNGIPYAVTHDARTIRFPDPIIKTHDSVKIDLATGRIIDFVKLETGVQVMITAGRNTGRVGILTNRERHPGSFDVVHVKDQLGHSFATRLGNVFVIGKGGSSKPLIKLPRGKGVKLTIAEERDKRLEKKTE
jgi:small subunit ribosomal protein S4e